MRLVAALAAVVVGLALVPPAPAHAGPPEARQTVPGSLMVTFAAPPAGGTAGRVAALLAGTGASSFHTVPLGQRIAAVDVPQGSESDVAAALRTQPGVLAVEPERSYPFSADPDDPRFPEQWAHRLANTPAAWERTTGAPDVTVAVLDSGVDGRHADLRGNLVAQVDVSTGLLRRRAVGQANATCGTGVAPHHGTNVAGVVGAVGNNGQGVAGAAWRVGIIDVALVSAESRARTGSCAPTDRGVIAGLQYVTGHPTGVDVVNLSLGGTDTACPTALQAAIDDARAGGVVVVAAAGNSQVEAPGAPNVPAACNGVVSVGAAGPDGPVADYSTQHETVDLVAPGGQPDAEGSCSPADCVLTTHPGGRYVAVAGTSFAAPYVAGVAALLRSLRPALTPDQVESLVERTAGTSGRQRTDAEGWGLVDAGAAVAKAAAGGDVAGPAADPPFRVGGSSGEDAFLRVARGDGRTEPVTQSVRVSQAAFAAGEATHAVLARSDVYADALAGSTLAGAAAPVLFTPSTGGLHPAIADELRRALPAGRVVYLLGGQAALDASVERGVRDLGYAVKRLRVEGQAREGTARAVAAEVAALREARRDPPVRAVLLANRVDWPDAVTAGQLGAHQELPVLLAYPDGLDQQTKEALAALGPERIYVVGGTGVVGDSTAADAARIAGGAKVTRLGGRTRDETTVAVSAELERRIRAAGEAVTEGIVVNLDRADGYAHVLSATVLAAQRDSVLVGVRLAAGTTIPPSTIDYACGRGVGTLLAGDTDLLPDSAGATVARLFRGSC